MKKKSILFSNFLNREQLKRVTYYSYFPVLEEGSEGNESFKLLPSDDAIAYTIKFHPKTKEIKEGEKNWYNEPLIDLAEKARHLPESKIKRLDFSKKKHSKCIIINLIDYCYGHSLVKLLNIENFYKDYSETHDLFVISFPDVEDYLPLDKFNSCLLDLSFSEIKKILNLESLLNKVKENYSEIDFAVLDAYLTIENRIEKTNFYNFYGKNENIYKDKKIVTFHYRADKGREWGGIKQGENVIELLSLLRPYFRKDVLFCVLGDKDDHAFPDWIIDKRIKKYPNPIVYEYSQIIASSVLIVSITGSNLVLPSLISKAMLVHFVKEPFVRLTGTDVVNYEDYSSQTTYDNIYIYEDGSESVKPKRLAFKLLRLFEGRLAIEYKSYSMSCLKASKPTSTQKDYILEKHSYFNYIIAKDLNNEINMRYWRAINRRHIIKRIINKVKRSLARSN
jgi:hypothetical protein